MVFSNQLCRLNAEPKPVTDKEINIDMLLKFNLGELVMHCMLLFSYLQLIILNIFYQF